MAEQTAATTSTALSWRRFKDGDHKHRPWQEEIFQASWSHKCPTYVQRTPPCQGSCPSGHDIRGWFDIVRGIEKPPAGMAWQEYLFRRMVEANPFPAVMGRVCPAPCETGCNRNEVEDHLGINATEHYIGDWAIKNGLKLDKPEVETGKKVAVIGGGPGGLSAAWQLRRRGHSVTVFEGNEKLGGMMRYGIPGYRTPRDVLDAEINRILETGVEARTNTRIGRDISLADLESQFDAIFWAIGAQNGRQLPGVAGTDAPNVVSAVGYLRAFNEGRLKAVSPRVVVIGGGDTSIDVSCVARRLGAVAGLSGDDLPEVVAASDGLSQTIPATAKKTLPQVTLTSLFTEDKMFATPREVADAKHEGVVLKAGVMPLEIVKDASGRAVALKMCQCTMKGMTPEPVAGTEFTLDFDLLVIAIGQYGKLEGIEALDNGKTFIDADKNFRVSGKKNQFVGGDIVRPHLLTTAIGHGAIAAEGIDTHLKGEELPRRPKVDKRHFNLLEKLKEVGLSPFEYDHQPTRGTANAKFAVHNFENRAEQEVIPADEMFLGHFQHTPRHKRQERHVDPDKVLGDFEERLATLDEKEILAESKRCMSCGMCFECDNCVVFCPQTAVQRVPKAERSVGRYVYTEYSKCIGCHICSEVCPTGYIQMGLGE
ncbi:MAG: NAD(P)-binding protein [Rhodospirillales bacterium]|nr:NAD(P)-binding protein [Rhodospirillales bacterium]